MRVQHALFYLFLAATTACGSSGTDPEARGELDVAIVGLPAATDAAVSVSGPNSYREELIASRILTNLELGTYTVTAEEVSGYQPVPQTQDASVEADSKTDVDVIYQPLFPTLHECSPYESASNSAMIPNTWAFQGEEKFHSVTPPAEPGPGILTMTLTTGELAEPWMRIRSAGDDKGAIASASASETDNEHVRTNVFESAPGRTYVARVNEFFNAPAEEHPYPYTFSWSYSGRMDCYEPNNTIDQAKAVPFNEVLEAYAIAGFVENSIADGDPNTFDWYSFELPTEMEVEIELLQSPSNVDVWVRLFNDDGAQLMAIKPSVGELFNESLGILTPGAYYLEFRPRPDTRVIDPFRGQSRPDHFDTPYQFQLLPILQN